MRQAAIVLRNLRPFGLSVALLAACLATSEVDAQPARFSNGGVKNL